MTRNAMPAVARDLSILFKVGAVGRLTDGQLLASFLDGRGDDSEAAFGTLVARHGPMVWGVCRRALADRHDAEDAFQATFLILVRKARQVRVDDSLGRWLHGVSTKVAARARVSAQKRRGRELANADALPAREAHDPEGRELTHIIDEEVTRLPAKYRDVVILCDLQGLSHDESARRIGCPVGTVKSRLTRGRERLKAGLARRGCTPFLNLPPLLPPQLEEATVGLVARLRLGLPLKVLASDPVITLMEGALRMMIVTKLKFAGTALLAVSCLIGSRLVPPALAGDGKPAGRQDVPKPEVPPPSDSETAKPEPPPQNPKPWETVVRIKVHGKGSIGFSSGTVILGEDSRSVAITSAHSFHIRPEDGRYETITVDLFDGILQRDKSQTRFNNESCDGSLIYLDREKDLALVEFRPGRRLKEAAIVPKGWTPARNESMVTAGCSEGRDATFWSTTVVGHASMPGSPTYQFLTCRTAPKQGRTGGGLFTTDGRLAGVCHSSNPGQNVGLYVAPATIQEVLATYQLKVSTAAVLDIDAEPILLASNTEEERPPAQAPLSDMPKSPDRPQAKPQPQPNDGRADSGPGAGVGRTPLPAEIAGMRAEAIMMEIQAVSRFLEKNNFGIPEDVEASSSQKATIMMEACDDAKERLDDLIDKLEEAYSRIDPVLLGKSQTPAPTPDLEARITSIERKLDQLLNAKTGTSPDKPASPKP